MRRIFALIVFLFFFSSVTAFAQPQFVRGTVFFEDPYWGPYPATGVFVRLCTPNRQCGAGTYTDRNGQFYLNHFPRGNVVLEVYPTGPYGNFVYFRVYVGNVSQWTLPPVTIRR